MCGGIVAFAAGLDVEPSRRPSIGRTQCAYHAGRLVSYVTVGAIAGALGAALNLTGSLLGLQRSASVLAGASIAALGIVALLRIAGVRVPRVPFPKALVALARNVHRAAFALGPTVRAGTIGLATPLLPCGWLYAFVVVATGAGSLVGGALVMLAFWIGTVPALAGVAAGLRFASGRVGRLAPLVASVAMVAVGAHIALTRAGLADAVAARSQSTIAAHASAHDTPDDRVRVASESLPACCRGDGDAQEPLP